MKTALKIPNSLLNVVGKVLWISGWCVLGIGAYSVLETLQTVYERYQMFTATPTYGLSFNSGFSFFYEAAKLAGIIGNAFLLLLLSSVLEMMNSSTRKLTERADRLMQVACCGYLVKSAIDLVFWLSTSASWQESSGFGIWNVIYSAFFNLLGFVFPIIIFVLYRRFRQLSEFESEVI